MYHMPRWCIKSMAVQGKCRQFSSANFSTFLSCISNSISIISGCSDFNVNIHVLSIGRMYF